jgi:hypothetical protein
MTIQCLVSGEAASEEFSKDTSGDQLVSRHVVPGFVFMA